MDVMKAIVADGIILDDLRYELIENLHMRLYSNNYKVKKNASSLIFALTKSNEAEFIIVFQKMMQRCIESKNQDLVKIFIDNLAEMNLIIQSDRMCLCICELVQNPLFSGTKECMMSLMHFLDNIISSTPVMHKNLSKTMFIFFCEHMRSLYVEIRKKAISVFKRMNLRQVDEELLSMSLKRETFADYASAMEKEKKS